MHRNHRSRLAGASRKVPGGTRPPPGPDRERWESLDSKPERTTEEERERNLLSFSTDFADRGAAIELARRWTYDRYPINYEANAAINADTAAEDDDDLVRRCRTLGIPALVVHWDGDPRPLAGPTALADALPNGRLVALEGVGHVPWAERPELLRRALRSWLLA